MYIYMYICLCISTYILTSEKQCIINLNYNSSLSHASVVLRNSAVAYFGKGKDETSRPLIYEVLFLDCVA